MTSVTQNAATYVTKLTADFSRLVYHDLRQGAGRKRSFRNGDLAETETTNQEIAMTRKKTSKKTANGMSPDKLANGRVELSEKELDGVSGGVTLSYFKIVLLRSTLDSY